MKPERLLRLVTQFPARSVAVVGDLILDHYVWGSASRISPEAPVPIVLVNRETVVPGGAANVARNALSLGAKVRAFGVVGRDENGGRLRGMLRQAGAEVAGVLTAADRTTTVKTRVLAGTQQVVRVDRETAEPISSRLQARLLDALAGSVRRGELDAIVLEDYAKGVVSRGLVAEVCQLANDHHVPVAMDPHPSHPYNVKGLRLMTPNRSEAFALAGVYQHPARGPVLGDRDLMAVGDRLKELWGVELLLITLGADGMALFADGKPPVHIPTRAREVFDVSGAGDTEIASFVLAIAAGAAPEEAAHLANHAAGIVVGKVGTASVTPDELREELKRHHG